MSHPTAVWTGSLVIVWQGWTGYRYSPASDSWTNVAYGPPYFLPQHALSNVSGHTAVWTGSRMIIWGGRVQLGAAYLTDGGGRYDPATNTWESMSLTAPPAARIGHTAIWTGSQMIVWGGWDLNATYFADGGRYDPVLDRWTPISVAQAPRGRFGHQAIWDGEGMIVFGGEANWNKGGRYIASHDSDHDGFTACGGDCDDASAAVHPGVAESCDGVDQDCNAVVDDAPDTDGDGAGACVDCAEGNGQVWAVPAEVANLGATAGAPATFAWDSLGPQAGSQISYDVVTGNFSVGGGFDAGSAACLGSTPTTAFTDARPDPAVNAGYWYLVGGRNICGRGTLGTPQRDVVGIGLCP